MSVQVERKVTVKGGFFTAVYDGDTVAIWRNNSVETWRVEIPMLEYQDFMEVVKRMDSEFHP